MLANKLVVIASATGTGKTRLSIDVAKMIGGEVLNADKMQIYAGLDIATNKVSMLDRCGVPHHLIGVIPYTTGDLSISLFRSLATTTTNLIKQRGHMPIVVGGSNSLIHGLLVDHFDPSISRPFEKANYFLSSRFQSCLLWIHANEVILNEHLNRRIDFMVNAGLVDEVKEYFDMCNKNVEHSGLGKAIGVPELCNFFTGQKSRYEAIAEIKANTQALAKAQRAKTHHMVDVWGWSFCSLDATETICAQLNGPDYNAEAIAWERDVRGPRLHAINELLQ